MTGDAILTCAQKADISQFNLPHRTKNKKKWEKTKKTKKWICSEVSVKVWGVRGVSPEEEKNATVKRIY